MKYIKAAATILVSLDLKFTGGLSSYFCLGLDQLQHTPFSNTGDETILLKGATDQ